MRAQRRARPDAVCPSFNARDPATGFRAAQSRERRPSMPSNDSLHTRRDLVVGEKTYAYYSLAAAEEAGLSGVSRLPVSMKVLLENLLRNEDGRTTGPDDLQALAAWIENRGGVQHEISFRPTRVLMQDFTGVPAVVDLSLIHI